MPVVPYLFQIDLRDDPKTIAKLNDMKEKPITTEQGQKLAKEVCMLVGLTWVEANIFTFAVMQLCLDSCVLI